MPQSRKRRAVKPPVTPDPPLVTLHDALRATGDWVQNTLRHEPNDADASFEAFVLEKRRWQKPGERLDARAFSTAYSNSVMAEDVVGSLARRIYERKGVVGPRAEAAGRCVHASALQVRSALLTHLRVEEQYEYATCILLRSGIELAARAIFIALGNADEVTRFSTGPRLRATEFWTTTSVHVETRRPGAWDPKAVYDWLCSFTHLDRLAMDHGADHDSAYAGLAYVAWLSAVAAEVVTGLPDLAIWPPVWPDAIPWVAPGG